MKAAQKWAYICRHIFPDVLHVLSASGCRLYLGLRGGCNVEMPEFELFHLHTFLNTLLTTSLYPISTELSSP